MKPDLNLLVVFDAVVRTGSVSAAARHLALSQPAISHALNRLRAATGDALFTRAGRGLVPTPHALAMMDPVRAMLQQAETLFRVAGFDPATSRQRFVIAASDYAAFTIMPQVMARIGKMAPHVQITLTPVSAQVPDHLATGQIDLSFWGAEVPATGLQYLRLFRETYVGVARAGHPVLADEASPVTLAAYLAHDHAVVSLRSTAAHVIDRELATIGQARRIAYTSHSFAGNLALLRHSDLIASIPRRLCTGLDPMLRQFELPLSVPGYDYGLVWHDRTHTPQSHVWMRGIILAVASATANAP